MVINQIAETIAKINKLEDFSKQQAYIKQSAEILKIEESGLIALVNKHIKEKVYKDETKASRNQEFLNDAVDNALQIDNDAALLLSKDEQHERAMVRSLLEFGNKPWNDEETVAKYMFAVIVDLKLLKHLKNTKF